jgi:1,4-alpha-glucan branching enzyme
MPTAFTRGSLALYAAAASLALVSAGCRTLSSQDAAKLQSDSDGTYTDNSFYEQMRIRGMPAAQYCETFRSKAGITVTRRDGSGNAVEGKITVLVDHPSRRVYVLSDVNKWGEARGDADLLKPVPGTPYYEGTVRGLRHGMQYRLEVDGESLLDPAATLFTSEPYLRSHGLSASPAFLNSVFWDYERPGSYRPTTPVVDLRERPAIIAEGEVYEMAKKFRSGDREGPRQIEDTYKFVRESGLIQKLRDAGYNAVEFLPFATSVDGDHWHYRYQVYGLYAPDSRYGDPDEFARMIDAFNQNGIAVIMDAVVGHYPFKANAGVRDLAKVGPHNWRKGDGKRLYGEVMSPWDTYRYDYANPFVRRFLSDSVMHMMCRYGIGGIRFDNLDGIRLYEGPGRGGPEFLKELVTEVRRFRPEALLIGEMFFGYDAVLRRLDQGGFGIGMRTHSDYFDFIKDNMLKSTEQIDLERLRNALRGPFDWKEAARVTYITNHDEAANRRDGATGSYPASLLGGGGWYYVERKTVAYSSLSLLASSAFLDLPQARLLQEGSFNDDSAVDWSLLKHDSQRRAWDWFADLSKTVKDEPAFAFPAFAPSVENHTDSSFGWRIVSLLRKDPKTGRRFVALVNLGHVGISNYKFGLDEGGTLRLALDSDAPRYGGTGELQKRLPTGVLHADGEPLHGKATSVQVPYLAPYGVVLLRTP